MTTTTAAAINEKQFLNKHHHYIIVVSVTLVTLLILAAGVVVVVLLTIGSYLVSVIHLKIVNTLLPIKDAYGFEYTPFNQTNLSQQKYEQIKAIHDSGLTFKQHIHQISIGAGNPKNSSALIDYKAIQKQMQYIGNSIEVCDVKETDYIIRSDSHLEGCIDDAAFVYETCSGDPNIYASICSNSVIDGLLNTTKPSPQELNNRAYKEAENIVSMEYTHVPLSNKNIESNTTPSISSSGLPTSTSPPLPETTSNNNPSQSGISSYPPARPSSQPLTTPTTSPIRLTFENSHWDSIGDLIVDGEVQNIGNTQLDYVKVNAHVYNSYQQLIGVPYTYIDNTHLYAGQTSTFKLYIDTKELSSYDIRYFVLSFEWSS